MGEGYTCWEKIGKQYPEVARVCNLVGCLVAQDIERASVREKEDRKG